MQWQGLVPILQDKNEEYKTTMLDLVFKINIRIHEKITKIHDKLLMKNKKIFVALALVWNQLHINF